jgi:hypothetical protein
MNATSMAELECETRRIRDASDIVAIVGAYVPLRRSGPQHVGLCPFHKEKTPSFYVHSAKQVYKCHGCGVGGDVFKFLQEIERVDFKQARALLAAEVGINTADRPLTVAERRDFAQRKEAVEWRDSLVESLRTERDFFFHHYHRLLRLFQREKPHGYEASEHDWQRSAVAMDAVELYEARYQDLDRKIRVLTDASPVTLVPFYKARGGAAQRVVAQHVADKQSAREMCAVVLSALAIRQARDGN